MPEQATWSLTWTTEELWILAGLLHAPDPMRSILLGGLAPMPYLIGVPDPFLGWLAEEIEDQSQRVIQALAARNHLSVQPNGAIVVDVTVALLVGAIVTARRTLVASIQYLDQAGYDPDALVGARILHSTPDVLVEQERQPEGQIILTAVRDADVLLSRLYDYFALPEAPAAPGPTFTLPPALLIESRRQVVNQGVQAGREYLERAGVPANMAEVLARVVAQDGCLGSLTALRRETRSVQYGDCLAWLAGLGGAWRVVPSSRALTGDNGQPRFVADPTLPAPTLSRPVDLLPIDSQTLARRIAGVVESGLR